MNQEKIPVLNSKDGQCPALGFGTWELTGENGIDCIKTAIATGYRHIDTARMYENEKEVGQAIAESGIKREDIFLTTKIFLGSLDAKSIHQEFNNSLELLNTEYVDLLLIHWPSTEEPLTETLQTMNELHSEGRTKHIGVSNFTISWLKKAIEISKSPIFCNQVEYHPFLNQDKLLNFCRDQDIPVVAYSPLGNGKVPTSEELSEIGEKYNKNAAQVALRWLLQQEQVGAIPRSGNPEHIKSNFEIFDFELSDKDMENISQLRTNEHLINPDFAPAWD